MVTKSYAKKPASQGGKKSKSVMPKIVKADYGDSGTNRAYSVTGKKVGRRLAKKGK